MRFFLELAYFGEAYCGWQVQPNGVSVQQTLEHALGVLSRTSIGITGQGRTDAGVHALQSFAHFDVETPPYDLEQWVYKLNAFLPADIAVKRIIPVTADAHARFSALGRSYKYVIGTEKDPFWQHRAWFVYRQLHVGRMREAAQHLMGKHDFTSFSSTRSDTEGRDCTITQLELLPQGNQLHLHISADRFVMNMVRTITGTLVEVGLGKRSPDEIPALLQQKDRRVAGENAPAHALYLREVKYPEHIFRV